MQHTTPLDPRDEYNERLESNVHPKDWKNPQPSGAYNLVVIGAGTAGLVAAAGAAGLGAKVALIERSLMGGDCLNVGCVPSKAIIAAARAAAAVKKGAEFGVTSPGEPEINFAHAMQRMRRLRSEISPNDSAERFKGLGVDVYFGEARFVDASTVEVDGTKLDFKRAVIASGARAAAPAIPGLDGVEYLTNETLFSLTELPRRLGIIGAGPIGCEMAQSFARLGAEVFLVESAHGVLPREDAAAAALVEKSMVADGVNLLCCGKDLRVENHDGIRLAVDSRGQQYNEQVEQLLVAVGRKPNVNELNLDAVGVEFDGKGVKVNDHLQTTNPRIFAAGDVCSRFQFTHAADFMARIVIQNALFRGRAKASALTIPWCTYTEPEVAHVGLYEHEAKEQGVDFDLFEQSFEEVDRTILEGEEGFAKVIVKRGADKILGATICGATAGDMIGEVTLAMTNGIGLKGIGGTIHPYPTRNEALRKLGDKYNRTRLTPTVKKVLATWLNWTR